MSLPPANTDPAIQPLRRLLQSIYTPVFTTFPLLQSIITTLSTNVGSLPSSTLVDDIAWCKEALEGDLEKLGKVQQHIKFLNAQETPTTKNEMLKVFGEVLDFTQLILLDDFVEILKGVSDTLQSQDEFQACTVKGKSLKSVTEEVQRFMISLKLACAPIRQIQLKELAHEEIDLSPEEISQIDTQLQPRLNDLEKRFDVLMMLA